MKEAKRLKKWLNNRNKIIDDYMKSNKLRRDAGISKHQHKMTDSEYLIFLKYEETIWS